LLLGAYALAVRTILAETGATNAYIGMLEMGENEPLWKRYTRLVTIDSLPTEPLELPGSPVESRTASRAGSHELEHDFSSRLRYTALCSALL
jgi:hypothetical protein